MGTQNRYNPQEREAHRQQRRLEHKTYAFDIENESKEVFSIDTPPPTISGKLHIGHIFSYTQAELIARYKRMKGFNVFYPMGYDNNGIPTENLVEKELGIDIKNVERRDFIKSCAEINKKYKEVYKNLRVSLGMSVDRDQSYATISPEVQQLVQQRFVKMFEAGQIVSKEFPALRCTKNQTTIAQAETEEIECDSFYNYVRFAIEDGGEIVIATTRPELMPACVAVVVNPTDARYTKFLGKYAITPFGDRVLVLGDELAKIDKGTGALQCCSFGDEIDTQVIIKNNLPTKIIVSRDGYIQDSGVAELDGLTVLEAREAIVPLIEATGAMVKREAIKQGIVFSERGKVQVEILPVRQRFVKILDQKDALKKLNDNMNWFPTTMQKRSTDWIDNLHRDWNISRSRKFGIPIPVWFSTITGEIFVPNERQLKSGAVDPFENTPDILPDDHTNGDIISETMVFDTWFTSGLTPDINQRSLERQGYTKSILPFSLRPQAHDIIRTRLLYTTVHSMYNSKKPPFKDVMMSGHVLAGKGEKISKSKGNASFEPVELLQKYGADATRYRALSGQLGKDMVFDNTSIENGQKLITKLRNAHSFVAMQTKNINQSTPVPELYPTDARIIGSLQQTITKMTDYLDRYEYGLAKIAFEDFFWHDFCDTYLEYIKTRLYKPETMTNGEQKKLSAQRTLSVVFFAIIRLIAPYLPHITEEVYQSLYASSENMSSIHTRSFPTTQEFPNVEDVATSFKKIKEIVDAVRSYKTQHQLSLGSELDKIDIVTSSDAIASIELYRDDLIGVTKTKVLNLQTGSHDIKITHTQVDSKQTQKSNLDTQVASDETTITDEMAGHDTQNVASWNESMGVRGIVIDDEGRIGCVHSKKDATYRLPGGPINQGEFEQQAFAREMYEELGVKAKMHSKIWRTVEHRSRTSFLYTNVCFVATIKGTKKGPDLTDEEIAAGCETLWLTYDELVDRLKDCAVLSYEQSFRTARDLTHLEKAKDVIQDICNNTK